MEGLLGWLYALVMSQFTHGGKRLLLKVAWWSTSHASKPLPVAQKQYIVPTILLQSQLQINPVVKELKENVLHHRRKRSVKSPWNFEWLFHSTHLNDSYSNSILMKDMSFLHEMVNEIYHRELHFPTWDYASRCLIVPYWHFCVWFDLIQNPSSALTICG